MVRKDKKELKWEQKAKKIAKDRQREEEEVEQKPKQPEVAINEIIEDPQPQPEPQPQRQPQPQPKTVLSLEQPSPSPSLSQILTLLSQSSSIHWRGSQISQLKEFLSCPEQHILYVCGVTGSGKTSTIVNTLKEMGWLYKIVNCMSGIKGEEGFGKAIEGWEGEGCLIIDECDFVSDLAKLVYQARQTLPHTKLILISNQNCTHKVQQLKQKIRLLLFMPYTEEQVIGIVGSKLGELVELVPKRVLAEGAKKAAKRSGDFREMEKVLRDWVDSMRKSEDNPYTTTFTDPFLQALQTTILSTPQLKNSILLSALKTLSIPNSKPQKKLSCKCTQSTISAIISEFRSQASKTQCLLYLREWEERGLIRICRARCQLHGRTVELAYLRMQVKMDTEVIAEMIRRSFYTGHA